MSDMFVHPPKSHGNAPRRRSHSHVNLRQTAELRRVSKQNSERTRRARISKKIVELHDTALAMIGQAARSSVHVKKIEMLNFCHEVLNNLRSLLEENPDVRARFQSYDSYSATMTATCQGCIPSHIPVSASAPTLPVSKSQGSSCDSNVHDLPASTPTSAIRSSSFENSNIDSVDCSVQSEESKGIWRPYLHCL